MTAGAVLDALGRIAGRAVPCLTPELQLRFHLGYEPGPTDRHDVALLRVM
jgi:lincosamide nucleotidyltransferase A/C/D/E